VDVDDANDGVKLKKNENKKQHSIEAKDSYLTFSLCVPKNLRLFAGASSTMAWFYERTIILGLIWCCFVFLVCGC
jgi:hypothetical protein